MSGCVNVIHSVIRSRVLRMWRFCDGFEKGRVSEHFVCKSMEKSDEDICDDYASVLGRSINHIQRYLNGMLDCRKSVDDGEHKGRPILKLLPKFDSKFVRIDDKSLMTLPMKWELFMRTFLKMQPSYPGFVLFPNWR